MKPYDAVVSVHTNPLTCGTAKFNVQLAERLGVPLVMSDSDLDCRFRCPLLSLRPAELRSPHFHMDRPYGLLLHDRSKVLHVHGGQCVKTVYADELGMPSTLRGNPTRGAYRVLVFGMAHKLQLEHLQDLKTQLDREHPDYTIELSTAVHEGSPWDVAIQTSTDAMRKIFGDKLRVLGFLGDDALAKELHDVDAVAMFYDPALRRNNTTYWAAVDVGKTIYTNRDAESPQPGEPPPTWEHVIAALTGVPVGA